MLRRIAFVWNNVGMTCLPIRCLVAINHANKLFLIRALTYSKVSTVAARCHYTPCKLMIQTLFAWRHHYVLVLKLQAQLFHNLPLLFLSATILHLTTNPLSDPIGLKNGHEIL